MLLGAFKKALDLILSTFLAQVSNLLRVIDLDNEESRQAGAEVLLPIVREYRQKSADLAAQMMQEEAEKLGADAHIPSLPTYRKEWLTKEMSRVASTKELEASLKRHVAGGARSLVQSAVPEPMAGNKELAVSIDEADPYDVQEMPGKPVSDKKDAKGKKRKKIYPIAFARVLTGPTSCAFCVMLASRGPVYSSASKAGAKGKGAVFTPWAPTDRWPNSYHNHCDCLVVPVFSDKEDWLGKDAVKPLYKLYRKVTKGTMNKSASGGENESLNAWKEYLDELSEKGEQLPVPELASPEYLSKTHATQRASQSDAELGEVDKFLAGNDETISAADIPKYATEKIFGPKFQQTSWQGKDGKGGHSPESTVPGKTHVPYGWDYDLFVMKTADTVQNPDYVSGRRFTTIYLKCVFDVQGNHLWFKVEIRKQNQQIEHAYPIAGNNVTEYTKEGNIVAAIFRLGTVKGVRRVI